MAPSNVYGTTITGICQYHDVLPILPKIKNNYNELMKHTHTNTVRERKRIAMEKGWLFYMAQLANALNFPAHAEDGCTFNAKKALS